MLDARQKLGSLISPDGAFRITQRVWELWNLCTEQGRRQRIAWCNRVGVDIADAEASIPPACGDLRTEPSLPPVASQLANFAKAITRHIVSGGQDAPLSVQKQRYDECRKCDRYRPSDDKCSECGCTLLNDKTKWATQSCPLGKWEEWTG